MVWTKVVNSFQISAITPEYYKDQNLEIISQLS